MHACIAAESRATMIHGNCVAPHTRAPIGLHRSVAVWPRLWLEADAVRGSEVQSGKAVPPGIGDELGKCPVESKDEHERSHGGDFLLRVSEGCSPNASRVLGLFRERSECQEAVSGPRGSHHLGPKELDERVDAVARPIGPLPSGPGCACCGHGPEPDDGRGLDQVRGHRGARRNGLQHQWGALAPSINTDWRRTVWGRSWATGRGTGTRLRLAKGRRAEPGLSARLERVSVCLRTVNPLPGVDSPASGVGSGARRWRVRRLAPEHMAVRRR